MIIQINSIIDWLVDNSSYKGIDSFVELFAEHIIIIFIINLSIFICIFICNIMNLNDRYSHVYDKEGGVIDNINNIGKGGFNFRKDYSFNFYSSIGKEILMFRDYNSINRYRFYSTSNKNTNTNTSFNINESESENVNMNELTNINNTFLPSVMGENANTVVNLGINNVNNHNISNLDSVVNESKILMKNKYLLNTKGGCKSYKIVTIFKDVIFNYNPELQMITIDKEALYKNLVKFLINLEEDKTYTSLFIAESWNYNRVVGTLSEHSILIHKDFSPKVLSEIIEVDINKFMSKYINNKYENIVDFKISVQYREWLDESKYGKDKFLKIKQLINKNGLQNLRKLSSINKVVSDDVNIINGLKNMNFYDFNLPYNYWFEKELFFNNSIGNKESSIELEGKDVIKLYSKFISTLNDRAEYLIDRGDKKDSLKIVFFNNNGDDSSRSPKLVNDCSKYNINKDIFIRHAEIYMVDNSNLLRTVGNKPLLKWIDFIGINKDILLSVNDSGDEAAVNKINYYNSYRIVERHVDNIKFTWDIKFKPTFINNIVDYRITNIDELFNLIRPIESVNIFNNYEQIFKLDTMEELAHEQMFNNKIGVIDLETCPEINDDKGGVEGSDNKMGIQKVYAGGWRVDDEKHFYYYGDKGCENQESLIKQMFTDIFECGYAKYTFYAHNLGKFDGHFIVRSLLVDSPTHDKFEDVKLIVGDSNEIIQIKIKRNKGLNIKLKKGEKVKYGEIKILDSFKLIPTNLDCIGKDMLNVKGKDIFPHNFMNYSNLFYEGNLPDIKFFNNISSDDYNILREAYKTQEWIAKDSCLKYLERDLDLLYDAIILFAKEIWNEYGVNLTSRKTISGLTLLIYQVYYYKKCGYKIPIINGALENYFRSAYFGGLTQIHAHNCDKAYHYDMNSQYPSAMIEDMPVGNTAIMKTVNNIDDCFGIIYADIVSPSIEDLRVPILPRKMASGLVDIPHKTKWSGWYSTIDLQTAIDNKYKVTPKLGIHFQKGKPFENFVKELYFKRLEAKENNNNVKSLMYKLLLNTLYGRMGMRSEFFTAKIIKKNEVESEVKYKVWNAIFDYSDTNYTLIKTGKHIDSKLIEIMKDSENENDIPEFKIDQRKRGQFTSIATAVTITARARRAISMYKNIPNNPLIYSDTDSVILPFELDNEYVGKDLGKMKLENRIKKGIFIGKKLYAYINDSNKVIIASAGINNDLLDWNDFKDLISGKTITKYSTKFIVKHSEGAVIIDNRCKFTIKGVGNSTPIQMHIAKPANWLSNNILYSLLNSAEGNGNGIN